MKIVIDDFLTAEHLGDATQSNPALGTIKKVTLIEADALPFKSEKDRYELTLLLGGEEMKWLANKTSLRALQKGFRSNTAESWIGKDINLWTVDQFVQGENRKVIYADTA